jgi:hypothetical protein
VAVLIRLPGVPAGGTGPVAARPGDPSRAARVAAADARSAGEGPHPPHVR